MTKSALKRKRAGRKRAAKVLRREANGRAQRGPVEPLMPTPERIAKGGVIDLVETMQAGVRCARVKHECLLDVLRDCGDLGKGQEATRRYDAGLWLRRLYLRTHEPVVVGAYGDQTAAAYEISDELAAAHSIYRRAMLALGPEFGALRQVCCQDQPARLDTLKRGLDRLANWRGI